MAVVWLVPRDRRRGGVVHRVSFYPSTAGDRDTVRVRARLGRDMVCDPLDPVDFHLRVARPADRRARVGINLMVSTISVCIPYAEWGDGRQEIAPGQVVRAAGPLGPFGPLVKLARWVNGTPTLPRALGYRVWTAPYIWGGPDSMPGESGLPATFRHVQQDDMMIPIEPDDQGILRFQADWFHQEYGDVDLLGQQVWIGECLTVRHELKRPEDAWTGIDPRVGLRGRRRGTYRIHTPTYGEMVRVLEGSVLQDITPHSILPDFFREQEGGVLTSCPSEGRDVSLKRHPKVRVWLPPSDDLFRPPGEKLPKQATHEWLWYGNPAMTRVAAYSGATRSEVGEMTHGGMEIVRQVMGAESYERPPSR